MLDRGNRPVPLIRMTGRAGTSSVAGDCQLANVAIDETTHKRPVHPLQVMARAYGLKEA